MTPLEQAARQALEALELHAKQYPHMQKGYTVDAITALSQALENHESAYQRGYLDGMAKPCIDCADRKLQALKQRKKEPVLQDIEQYRIQMAGICTAAIGYWKEADGIHPDYDTLALRDVAKLYAKYDALYKAQQEQEPVACNHGWFRTGAMAPGEARCIKCGEWKNAEPPKSEWVGLTPNERWDIWNNSDQNNSFSFAIAVEAKLKELNT